MNGWRTALRLARRSVRRHLGRSLLIIALIALPVAGATLADGLVRSVTDLDVEVDRTMGTADAIVTVRDRQPFDVAAFLPPGSRAVPLGASYSTDSLRLAVGDRIVRSRLDMVVLGDPFTRHLARLASGRLPKGPAETLVTEPLAERLDLLEGDGELRPGATVRPTNGPEVTVTGLAVKSYCLNCADVVAPPDTLLKRAMLDGSPLPTGYLVDLPAGVDQAELTTAWPDEARIIFRSFCEDTTPFSGYLSEGIAGPITLFAGVGLLGIVVTAAAAFAVGARRQVRELGLIAVNGGTARHVRRIVLAQGVVLGMLGAATGLVLGAAATVLGMPLWERLTNQLIEDLRFSWVELAVAAAVGLLASVVAATVPAFAVARMRSVDAMAGRFRVAPAAGRPLLGTLLVLAGMATVIAVGVVERGQLVEWLRFPTLNRTPQVAGILVGAVVALIGLLLVMPALVTTLGRLGHRLPLSGRLAIRDAVRHQHRTVGAAAAITITVTGSIMAAFVFASQAGTGSKMLPDNTALAVLDGVGMTSEAADGAQQLVDVHARATRALPGAVVRNVIHVSGLPGNPMRSAIWVRPHSPMMDCHMSVGDLGVGTPELIELSTGRKPDARMRSALAEGKVVVFDECVVGPDGTVVLDGNLPAPTTMPAYRAPLPPTAEVYTSVNYVPRAFISPEAAAARGWTPYTDSVAITYPTPDDLDAIRTVVEDAGVDLFVPASTDGYVTGLYLALAGLAGLVALLGAGVTVALSATDGRTDLATLAALGAPPRQRRLLAGAQALVVTTLGTLAGLVLGVCAGFAAVPLVGLPGVPVPWQHLLLTTLAVPLLASAVAVVVTPSRLVPRS